MADSSEDSDLESVDGGVDVQGAQEKGDGDVVSRRTPEQVLPASDSVEEAETQKTLQGLMELGKLLGGQQEAATDTTDVPGKDTAKCKDIAIGTNGVAGSPGASGQLLLSGFGTEHEVEERDVGESSGEESSDDDPLVTPMLLPSNLREHRWDGYTPDPLMCAVSASPRATT
jgi:hypothetical protein